MKKDVLVVDDGEDILEGIKIVLEDEGYSVQTLTNSMEVIEVARKVKPSLILLDYMMPGIDGGKVAERIRKEKDLRKVPVVMFSASQELEKVGRESGVNDVLAKPFEIDALVDKVKKYLD